MNAKKGMQGTPEAGSSEAGKAAPRQGASSLELLGKCLGDPELTQKTSNDPGAPVPKRWQGESCGRSRSVPAPLPTEA